MEARTKLKPGQKGTKKLVAQYGDALICVRYRYDVEKRKQFKTVEIIVSEADWTPSPVKHTDSKVDWTPPPVKYNDSKVDWTPPPVKYNDSELVPLRIGFNEKALQEQARGLGGFWDRERQLWFVRYVCIAGTKLEKLIIVETSKKDARQES